MSQGPLSPDGRHQLLDGEWVPVPKPPVDWWVVFCAVLLTVIVVAGLLLWIATEFG